MSREIKFRIWTGVRYRGGAEVFIGDGYCGLEEQVEPHILEQYTGRHDKNGVEIYEGDILKLTNPEHEAADFVDYETVPAVTHIVYVCRANTGEYYGTRSTSSYYTLLDYDIKEVIGNIHENKDLLK